MSVDTKEAKFSIKHKASGDLFAGPTGFDVALKVKEAVCNTLI